MTGDADMTPLARQLGASIARAITGWVFYAPRTLIWVSTPGPSGRAQ